MFRQVSGQQVHRNAAGRSGSGTVDLLLCGQCSVSSFGEAGSPLRRDVVVELDLLREMKLDLLLLQ